MKKQILNIKINRTYFPGMLNEVIITH